MKSILKKFVKPLQKVIQTFFKNRLSSKDQIFFIKRLSFLMSAGVTLLESLQMLREQTKNKSQIIILDLLIIDILNGQSLSVSLSRFNRTFGEFSINIIHVGESTGTLSENLNYLAEELRKKHALKRKIIGACVYPAVVTMATFGITIFLMLYLFPKITPIFSSLHMTLPLSTRALMSASTLLQHHGILIVILMALILGTLFTLLQKNPKLHFYFDRCLLYVPIVGKVATHYNLSSSTRTLGILLKSGITISEALPITAKVSKNLIYKTEFENVSLVVNRGEKMSTYLKTRSKIFPEVLSQIISVGERSGNLSNSLTYLSELYESEIDDFTKNLSNIIEPVLMIFMGLLVGFIAISIITPIYSITQNLHP